MKVKILKVSFCILLIGCKPPYQVTHKQQIKESYLYAFKMNYFKNLLLEGFNRSDEIKNILVIDRSGYGESILSTQDISLTDSLAKIDNKSMAQDSINRRGRVGEGAQGKHVFTYALYRFQSKWLDSLAYERYKIFIKENDKEN